MKGKGKAVETSSWFSDSYPPCKKHPFSSQPTVGICAFCLKDRLIRLVCSDCGEQRLSSCSCSDISSNRNSCGVEVGSVGRISFLIENEKSDIETPRLSSFSRPPSEKSDANVLLKRSSSCSVPLYNNGSKNSGKKNPRFWNLGRLFKRKLGSSQKAGEKFEVGFDEKNEMWVFDFLGLSRSRSVGGFRGGFPDSRPGFDGSSNGFSESEPRFSNSNTKRTFSESHSGYGLADPQASSRDLKVSLSESEPDLFGDLKIEFSDIETGLNADLKRSGSFQSRVAGSDQIFSNGGPCRVTVDDQDIKKIKKSLKVWKWVFRHSRRISVGREWEEQSANPAKGGVF